MGRPLTRYRVNSNVAGLKHGEIIEIDDSLDYWRPLIERGRIEPAPGDDEADLAELDELPDEPSVLALDPDDPVTEGD